MKTIAVLALFALSLTAASLPRGTGEVFVGGGVQLDRNSKADLPSFSAAYAAGITNKLAGVASYGLFDPGPLKTCGGQVCVPVKGRRHEFTGGLRFAPVTYRRLTPYASGFVGLYRNEATVETLNIGTYRAKQTLFIGGPGIGVEYSLTKWLGIQAEYRFVYGRDDLHYRRATIGFYFRHK